MPTKTEVRCFKRWQEIKDRQFLVLSSPEPQIMYNNNSLWSFEEDAILREKVEEHGTKKWAHIADYLPNRIGR
jgi:hypothetical protein